MRGHNQKGQLASIHMKKGKVSKNHKTLEKEETETFETKPSKSPVTENIMAYDIKEKKKVKMLDPKVVMFNKDRGIWAWKGKSSVSGNPVFRIIGKNKPKV